MTDHKIVCWGDYAIPVPLWANWMAMDGNGNWFSYKEKPKADLEGLFFGKAVVRGIVAEFASPPEPGPWNEQLYWIGDENV